MTLTYHEQFLWQWREAHPLITGLFMMLPRTGEPWSQADRERWLQTAETVFWVLFTTGAVEGTTTTQGEHVS